MAPDPTGEKEIPSTTVTEVDRSILNTSGKQFITTMLPKNPVDTTPINYPSKIGPKLSIF